MNTTVLRSRWIPLALPALMACAVTRPIDVAPRPEALEAYLASHHPPALLVTDSGGRAQWLYAPRLDGDSLRGLPSRDFPLQNVAVPVGHVRALAAQRFSAGRTVGLFGGILAALVAVVLLVPEPDY